MRFGFCTNPRVVAAENDSTLVAVEKLAALVYEVNADYVELGVGVTQPDGDEADWHQLRDALHQHELKVLTWNAFLPPHQRLTGPRAELGRALNYARAALNRVREAGGEVVVLGSSGARRIPDGFPYDKAYAQFVEFCRELGPIAEDAGITIGIEALNRREDNLVNLLQQGVFLVDEVRHPRIRLITDQFHMDAEDETYSHIVYAGERICHAHTCEANRKAPGASSTPQTDFVAYFRALREAGYAERPEAHVSIEALFGDVRRETAAGLALLRQSWDESGA